MTPARSGLALLEVLVAISMLGIAGLAFTRLTAQASRSVTSAAEQERSVLMASRFMNAVTLWPRDDFDRRLGSRRQGPFRLTVRRRGAFAYGVELHDSTGTVELVRTVVFRPADEEQHESR